MLDLSESARRAAEISARIRARNGGRIRPAGLDAQVRELQARVDELEAALDELRALMSNTQHCEPER